MGLKFADFPNLPVASPVADTEAAHKKYVDDSRLGAWIDCSKITTVSAINAAAAAAPVGSTIWLGPRSSASPLVVDATLIIQERQRWLGAGGRSGLTVLRASATLGAGLPMMASVGWYNNAADADEAVWVEGIKLDINAEAGHDGLVVYNFWSTFTDLHILGANGAATACLRATDKARNGTTISSNSHSENTFTELRFDATTNYGKHFVQESFNNLSNQDGHLTNSFFAGADGNCIELARAAGWTVQNNHLYGVGEDGISADRCYGTKIQDNYVEDFGRKNEVTAPHNGFYSGISLTMLDGKPSVCSGNTVSLDTPTTPAYVRASCIAVRPGSAQLKARVVVNGNTVTMSDPVPATAGAEAYRIGEVGDTGRTLTVTWAGNQIGSRGEFPSQIFRSNSSTRMTREPTGVRSYTGVTGTHVLDNEFELVQNFTVTGNVEIDPPAANTFARDGEPFQLRFLASGATRTITFDASMRTSTGVTRGPHSVASGEMLFATVEWSALVNDYIITAVTVSAN